MATSSPRSDHSGSHCPPTQENVLSIIHNVVPFHRLNGSIIALHESAQKKKVNNTCHNKIEKKKQNQKKTKTVAGAFKGGGCVRGPAHARHSIANRTEKNKLFIFQSKTNSPDGWNNNKTTTEDEALFVSSSLRQRRF